VKGPYWWDAWGQGPFGPTLNQALITGIFNCRRLLTESDVIVRQSDKRQEQQQQQHLVAIQSIRRRLTTSAISCFALSAASRCPLIKRVSNA